MSAVESAEPLPVALPTAPVARLRARLTLAGLTLALAAFYLPWITWTEQAGPRVRHINISGGELAHAAWRAVPEYLLVAPDVVRVTEGMPRLLSALLWLPLFAAISGLAVYYVVVGRRCRGATPYALWAVSLLIPFGAGIFGIGLDALLERGHNATMEINGQILSWASTAEGSGPWINEAFINIRPGCGLFLLAVGWLMAAGGTVFLKPEWSPPKFSFEKHAPILALAVLVIASTFLSDTFPKTQNLLNILRQVSNTGLIAVGMTLVIISGGIDLSVGSMTALAGAAALVTVNQVAGVGGADDGWFAVALAALAAVGLAGALGTLNGLLVTVGRIAPFIATLGTMAIFRSLALYWSQGGEIRSESALLGEVGRSGWIPLGGSPEGLGFGGELAYTFTPSTLNNLFIPTPVWIWLLTAALFAVLLNKTPFGRHLCAVGSNERVARYAGLRVQWIRLRAYVLAGITVGLSGFLLSARLNSMASTNAGQNYELDAIAAVIMGGTPLSGGRGTIWGTVVGALLLGVINNMLNMMGVSTFWQGTVKGLAILVAVLIQRRANNP